MNLDIGKQKQPFAFEIGGLSILYPQQERNLSPFFVTRSIGIITPVPSPVASYKGISVNVGWIGIGISE